MIQKTYLKENEKLNLSATYTKLFDTKYVCIKKYQRETLNDQKDRRYVIDMQILINISGDDMDK